jgi:hypothetical protein
MDSLIEDRSPKCHGCDQHYSHYKRFCNNNKIVIKYSEQPNEEDCKNVTVNGLNFSLYYREDEDTISFTFCEICNKVIVEGGYISKEYKYNGCTGVCGKVHPPHENEDILEGGCGRSFCGLRDSMFICVECGVITVNPSQDDVKSGDEDFVCSFCE